MKIIDEQLISGVVEQAKKSPRLRMNYNFHESLQDKCHRFLNALEPGTFIPADVVSLEFLLQMFFKAIDPTSLNKQGHDEGTRYRTGIYYTNDEDLPVIERILLATVICLSHSSSLQGKQKKSNSRECTI